MCFILVRDGKLCGSQDINIFGHLVVVIITRLFVLLSISTIVFDFINKLCLLLPTFFYFVGYLGLSQLVIGVCFTSFQHLYRYFAGFPLVYIIKCYLFGHYLFSLCLYRNQDIRWVICIIMCIVYPFGTNAVFVCFYLIVWF